MLHNEPTFRGWTKPGPIPPGAQGCGPKPQAGETLDAISGYFRLFQLEKGHRFSTDDVLTAWAQWCVDQARRQQRVYVYFNNDIDGHAPRDAQRLQRLITRALAQPSAQPTWPEAPSSGLA